MPLHTTTYEEFSDYVDSRAYRQWRGTLQSKPPSWWRRRISGITEFQEGTLQVPNSNRRMTPEAYDNWGKHVLHLARTIPTGMGERP